MKRKKLLQEQVEDKLRAEMAWFRNEIKPLKERQRQILDELENLI
jgi:hypothetical protein